MKIVLICETRYFNNFKKIFGEEKLKVKVNALTLTRL